MSAKAAKFILGSANVHHDPQVKRAHSEPVSNPQIPKATPTDAADEALTSYIGFGSFRY